MLNTTAPASCNAPTTLGFAGGRISCPYGLIYQILSIRLANSGSLSFSNTIFLDFRLGWDPGKLASSTSSSVSSSSSSSSSSLPPACECAPSMCVGQLKSGCSLWWLWYGEAKPNGVIGVAAPLGAVLYMFSLLGNNPATFLSVGCEIWFCPTITVPSASPAAIWCANIELIAGTTWTWSGTPVMDLKR